jgi:hypothetical protein
MGLRKSIVNGKIVKAQIPKVLKLLEYEVESLKCSFSRLSRDSKNLKDFCSSEDLGFEKNEHDTERYLRQLKLFGLACQLAHEYYLNLVEFFYGKEEPDEGEYFYYHFPLDQKSFEKERIEYKDVKKFLNNNSTVDEKMLEYILYDLEVFYKYLKKTPLAP